jgi:hypothetical protein
MTLILAIPAIDGLIMASDSQITTGEVRTPGGSATIDRIRVGRPGGHSPRVAGAGDSVVD